MVLGEVAGAGLGGFWSFFFVGLFGFGVGPGGPPPLTWRSSAFGLRSSPGECGFKLHYFNTFHAPLKPGQGGRVFVARAGIAFEE